MTALEKCIGYQFKDAGLLKLALTHPSIASERNNQRLEFLGDAVLGMLVAELLYKTYPGEQEGELARRQAALVRSATLAQVARDINLGEALVMASGEIQMGGRNNPTNLEDAVEALIGALYLDGGIKAAYDFVVPRWQALAEMVKTPPKDAKTALQEWAQAQALPLPVYKLANTEGAAHAPIFTVEVILPGYASVEAQATSKRAAEQMAAELFLQKVGGLQS